MQNPEYHSTPPSPADGSTLALQTSARGALKVAATDAAGAEVVKTDDAALATGCSFTPTGGIVDDTGTGSASEGDGVVARFTARRAALTTLDTLIAGEDQTNNVLKVEEQFSGTQCTADTQVKASAGFLHSITFSCNDAAPTAGSIIVYDNTAESGTQVFNHTFTTTPFMPFTVIFDLIMTTGIYAGFTTTADVNAQINWR